MHSSSSRQIDLLAPTRIVAGVDEAGRGCLAGPVYAAAVVLDPKVEIKGLNDSKKLSAVAREKLFDKIQQGALSWSIARAESHEIDSINILQASLLAMKRAVETLTHEPHEALVDGNQAPKLSCKVTTIIDGDALEPSIMAASILAKVARDREMERLDAEFPGYGFSKHKGYGTAQHMTALRQLGVTSIHRMSFAPCAATVARESGIGNRESLKEGATPVVAVTIPDSRFSIPGAKR